MDHPPVYRYCPNEKKHGPYSSVRTSYTPVAVLQALRTNATFVLALVTFLRLSWDWTLLQIFLIGSSWALKMRRAVVPGHQSLRKSFPWHQNFKQRRENTGSAEAVWPLETVDTIDPGKPFTHLLFSTCRINQSINPFCLSVCVCLSAYPSICPSIYQ